jgi:hypothetical protein
MDVRDTGIRPGILLLSVAIGRGVVRTPLASYCSSEVSWIKATIHSTTLGDVKGYLKLALCNTKKLGTST